jgi:hypothetical protein
MGREIERDGIQRGSLNRGEKVEADGGRDNYTQTGSLTKPYTHVRYIHKGNE